MPETVALLQKKDANKDNLEFDTALSIALSVHSGQVDKSGTPYILHPIRVALNVRPGTPQVVAILHDVLEDARPGALEWVHRMILDRLGTRVMGIVDLLTRRRGEEYTDYIERLRMDPIAREVKIADLEDNLDPARHAWCAFSLPDKYFTRYTAALAVLLCAQRDDVEIRTNLINLPSTS